jgi:Bacterial membrane protein YfhO
MRHGFTLILIVCCFAALFLICYGPALLLNRQFGYRDAGQYYYPLYQHVQSEWSRGRWPLWEPEENSGMPLLGNPTAAVLYPGKLVFALLPYEWGARVYIVSHTALAFLSMLVMMRSWGTSWFGSALSALAYAFGVPILFQHCNIIYLIGAAWLPLGFRAVDRWVRLGRRWGLLELAIVLSMQVLAGDPQAAYLLGLASIGYAVGLTWRRARSRMQAADGGKRGPSRLRLRLLLIVIAVAVWFVLTLALAQWLPGMRPPGRPPLPLSWMPWAPWAVSVAWGLAAIGFLLHLRGRAWREPLGAMWLGLAGSAILSVAVTAAQLLPVIEFIQQTGRSSPGPREIYGFSLEPFRPLELAWPNFLGVPFEGKSHWGDLIRIPGGRPKGWVPSLYLGGLALALALSALTIRRGPPWRVWLTAIAWAGLLGSLGQYTSPIWVARALAVTSDSAILRTWLPDIGPLDPPNTTTIRIDGQLRDGDGGFYWWLATVLPGFRQFRYPAKLFTLAALGMAALAGWGWDDLSAGRSRRTSVVFFVLFILTITTLAGVILQRAPIIGSFRALKSPSMYGPFEAGAGYEAIIRGLGQATLVLGLGLSLTVLARRRPWLAGMAALMVMTADLAVANARYVLTVPQFVLETKPEVLEVIEDAERADPSPGPFRIHRMPVWYPMSWGVASSQDRTSEIAGWERDTLQPKHGINFGLEYTHTLGVAIVEDYDRFFASSYGVVRDRLFADSLGIEAGQKVIYQPRRAYDMWNTRYFIVPFDANGWLDSTRGSASFLFQSDQVYPDGSRFVGARGTEEAMNWIDTRDFRVIRNRVEYPRAWIVHEARATIRDNETSMDSWSKARQEILYAGDPMWHDPTLGVYDPRTIAWVGKDDFDEMRRHLSNRKTSPSETAKVIYPNPQKAVLEVRLDSPGLVILADIYYPGWVLAIDGKPAPIYRVNGAMRGAVVPSGVHQLVYTYAPEVFRVGRLVSIVGLFALLILGLSCTFWPVDAAIAGQAAN